MSKQLFQCDNFNHEYCPARRNVLKGECSHFKPHIWSEKCEKPKENSFPDRRVCITWGIMNDFFGSEDTLWCECKEISSKKTKIVMEKKEFPSPIQDMEL